MELFPENSVMFTINNLKHFIKPFLENPVNEYKRIGLFFFCFFFFGSYTTPFSGVTSFCLLLLLFSLPH